MTACFLRPLHTWAILASAIQLAATPVVNAQNLLPPELAYQVASHTIGPDAIEFEYRIAPGYILYKDRFAAELVDVPGRLDIELPPAMAEEDPATHRLVEFYRNRVTMRVRLPRGIVRAEITTTAQGCAVTTKVCYPPMKDTWIFQRG